MINKYKYINKYTTNIYLFIINYSIKSIFTYLLNQLILNAINYNIVNN